MYIALEGIDGSGKSTQVKRLTSLLDERKVSYSLYSYTGRDNQLLGRLIARWQQFCRESTRPLGSSDRLIQELLYSINARRNWRAINRQAPLIVGDRSILTAFVAHRGLLPSRKLSWLVVRLLELGIPIPDAVILIDIDPASAHERVIARCHPMESDETLSKACEMRRCYAHLQANPPFRVLRQIKWQAVDGNAAPDEVFISVRVAFESLLNNRIAGSASNRRLAI